MSIPIKPSWPWRPPDALSEMDVHSPQPNLPPPSMRPSARRSRTDLLSGALEPNERLRIRQPLGALRGRRQSAQTGAVAARSRGSDQLRGESGLQGGPPLHRGADRDHRGAPVPRGGGFPALAGAGRRQRGRRHRVSISPCSAPAATANCSLPRSSRAHFDINIEQVRQTLRREAKLFEQAAGE